ncbi:protein CHLOROPLAST IMPORT APPARATUS 2-like isoform X1 [Chenopodium quinoa]|uniref:protein CHLOROPLAST IMPORT APPARATUS 2-like isoform X1 n=1 Tax=Chenopodium quinoa TaxID=63459 RepID=UPI000B796CB8|nr:protein CHLOROPLAST IMPORT APPARATUS 2-like isoform X1 [Chenopodium quinoa]XP_021757295.1 protein CHLOROPLAST IMPORT APPARATUS 2-like isoform X1 [Chenopodium quinoa]XP_021757296.1 protein CHLOROPLAST IMPORT APPARATUS 2-like isoform X1 [Chenopodium quinoa]
MSSCLSGGGRAAYAIDLDIIKSPSTSTRTSHSSSPSSTISESSNSPLAISTRKPRTPRKRPNQTYNEAAALLSTAYPNIFPAKDMCKPGKFIKPREYSSFSCEEPSGELLLPFPVEKPVFQLDSTAYGKSCSYDMDEIGCHTNSSDLCDGYEDFDAESILDEEIGEGAIDSIMGDVNVCVEGESTACSNDGSVGPVSFCYGYPVGLGLGLGLGLGGRFDFGFGLMRGGVAKAFRQNDEGDWWRFPAVDVGEISPRLSKPLPAEKKKKLEKVNTKSSPSALKKENSVSVPKSSPGLSKENSSSSPKSSSTSSGKENSTQNSKSSPGVLLKLNYDEVLDAWSNRGSPFSDDIVGSELSGSDALQARLAQIDLFGEPGALREASVQRYKEKRRTRFFSKKIRYQVRKVNADQRPRMKVCNYANSGRFVRRPNSSGSEENEVANE